MLLCYRCFLFDNSAHAAEPETNLVAEIKNGEDFIPHTEDMPNWVAQYVIAPLFAA